jgi:hypothetical protein
MKYNLGEYLALKTNKQVVCLIKARYTKNKQAFEFNWKYDNYPYNEIKRYETKIRKNEEIMEDCSEWFKDACAYFSEQLWDEMMASVGAPLESHGHAALMDE